MRSSRRNLFVTIRTEGAILPSDLLKKIADNDKSIEGLTPEAFHLVKGEKINEAISYAWNRLLGVWSTFKAGKEKLPKNDLGTTLTRERWLLPLFSHTGYGRLQGAKSIDINGKSYPISHSWQKTPIHLIGCNVELDKRTAGVAGAARSSPHGLVQELLNRSDDHLWAFLSNGLKLRILRDNVALTRQAYIEFDLEAMMESEVYSDFILLWLLCHQSRVEAERPEECWLERWSKLAQNQGIRALNQLRNGVEKAIKAFGSGFISHPANSEFKEKLKSGSLSKEDYYRELLRLIYRLIFLFVAEDRELIFDKDAGPDVRDLYMRYYSTDRLRKLAAKRKGTRHGDLWRGLNLVFGKLGTDQGCPELGLPALGSFLWSPEATPNIDKCELANIDLLDALRELTQTRDNNLIRQVDYKNLGSEELGSVYESLLELHPEINSESGAFDLGTAGGHERKTTGSYYTPSSLVQCLLDSALDPVLDEASKKDNPEKAILDLKVCDPACGSGHFLIAAAHRMAKRLAAICTGDDEPSPEATRTALRDIIGHCIYGVDINPLAVELCKVSLWMEALEPGKPLSFLEHKIQCGNSLLGTTPALLEKGIPDDAFKPIEGDDKAVCSRFKKENKQEKGGRLSLLDRSADMPWERQGDLATGFMNLDDIPDDTIEGIRKKQERYARIRESSDYLYGEFWADSWCSAFVWKKKITKELPYPITEERFRRIEKNPRDIPPWMRDEIIRLKDQYKFFHWHIAYPTVFKVPTKSDKPENEQTGWNGGFDVVLGNPPWERIKLQKKEWFANRRPDIANASNASIRRKLIASLKAEDPIIFIAFLEDHRRSEGESHLVGDSQRYPLCGGGDINTYAVFAELKRSLINKSGRVGCIVPSGIATDDTTKLFFQTLLKDISMSKMYDFENAKGIFSNVHRSYKFCLLTFVGSSVRGIISEFAFFLHGVEDLSRPDRRFNLTLKDVEQINPNTLNCPIFRSNRDKIITLHIHSDVEFMTESSEADKPSFIEIGLRVDNTKQAYLFISEYEAKSPHPIPFYEGKMLWQFDHRYASWNGNHFLPNDNKDQRNSVIPQHFLERDHVLSEFDRFRNWTIAVRRLSGAVNERTVVAAILPECCPAYSLNSFRPRILDKTSRIIGALNSTVLDFVARQKLGGNNLTWKFTKQLPLTFRKIGFISDHYFIKRVVELSYVAWDLEPFAKDCGYDGPPFFWDEERRFKIRCELDAAYFHLYLGTQEEWKAKGSPELLGYFPTSRDAAEYVMETFPIVKRKDIDKYGSYRTKELILEIYDAMAEAIRTGKPYETILDPPPGPPTNPDGTFAKLPDWPAGTPKPKDWPPHIHEPRRE